MIECRLIGVLTVLSLRIDQALVVELGILDELRPDIAVVDCQLCCGSVRVYLDC